MEHQVLLHHCVTVLDTYNKEIQAVEDHVNQYLKKALIFTEDEQTFIVEVFSGCVRYAELLNVVLKSYYAKDGMTTLNSEKNLLAVLTYLALFRLDELGMANYRQFIRSQDLNSMYKFLRFFFNEKSIMSWMKDEWQKYYEHVFVQKTLVSPLRRWLPELTDMVQQMKEKIDNFTKPTRKALTLTGRIEIKPFKLTQPRPKSVPVPEPILKVHNKKIPKLEKHKGPPSTLYKEPSEHKQLENVKLANRRKAEERLMDASRRQFACANPEKSHKTKEKIQQIMDEEDRKLNFNKSKSNKAPSFLGQDVPVKMTAAAILREGALYQKREIDEIKRLESLEAGAVDNTKFEQWQSEMRRKDMETRLAEIERRRLEGKIVLEEAILARQNIMQENKLRVAEIKEETHQMMQRYLQEKFEEEQQMKQLVEDTMKGHKNAKEAQKKLQEYKQKIVQEVAEESQELMKHAIEEAVIEMRRRMELIHQIRAMEAVPIIRHQFVDMTATSGHGLLSEMSIAELRERLALLKNAEREEEETRRDEIIAGKEAKDQLLLDTLEKISKHRFEQTKSNAIKLEQRKTYAPSRDDIQTEELTSLQKRLEEKKQQRIQVQAASRKAPNAKSSARTKTLINQKKHIEESRWKELEATREKSAQHMQNNYAQSASRLNAMMSAT